MNQSDRREAARILRVMALVVVVIAVPWVLMQFLWDRFPYIRNGTRIIFDVKMQRIEEGTLFQSAEKGQARILVFGDSRILSGFVPKEFDRLSGGRTFSYNLGFGGDREFVEKIDRVVSAGTPPTHVFLFLPWATSEFEPSIWRWFESDKKILEKIAPFRTMPRDFAVFLALARRRGGIQALYEFGRQSAEQIVIDRGYYFIAGQSHFPNDELPENFAITEDDPDRIDKRLVIPQGPQFEGLRRLVREYGIQFWFIPGVLREKWCAEPPPVNLDTMEALKPYDGFDVIGPDYFRFPNNMFSDVVHLNRPGALQYTRELWNVTRSIFDKQVERIAPAAKSGMSVVGRIDSRHQ